MKNPGIYILFLMYNLWPTGAFSQTDCVTNPPLPPVLTSVSVQPETGNTRFTWTLSPSPDIAAYILYSYKNGDGMPLDTIWDPAATSYTLSSNVTKYFSVSYVIAAWRRPTCTSILSNVLNSIFEEVSIDTCTKRIIVTWNSYQSMPVKVTGYSVLLSVNGGAYTESGNTDAGETRFILNDFTIDAEYCFVVRANLEDGSYSASNKICISTKMQRPPQWINADQATIDSNGNVALSFTIDPLSAINRFSLERRIGPSGSFQEISKPVSVNGKIYYVDIQADIKIINYYRLSAINSCNIPVTVSNLASNIVLSLERSGNDIILSWNHYKKWLGIISSYRLFIDTGKGFEEKAEIAATDSTYTLGYQQIMYGITGNEVCFFISASETSDPHGVSGQSHSSKICSYPTELITVPNVFTPNNDLVNDFFKPVLSFTPLDYQLIISNRKGKILFETRDYHAEWDGSQNGDPEPQGVCLWFLKVTAPSGKVISRTGTLTIVRNLK
jgi:gliding motility-associated-like protein